MGEVEEVEMTVEQRDDGYYAIINKEEIGPREKADDLILEVAMRVAQGEFGVDPLTLTSIQIRGYSKLKELFLNPIYGGPEAAAESGTFGNILEIGQTPLKFSARFQEDHE
jgi:hypothetical protein